MKNTITLSELANKRDIFIDYSAVFNTHFVNMMIEQARPLHDAQKQITVHRSVLNELTKLAENGSIGDSTIAKERIAQLNALNSAGVVNYIGNSLEPRSSNQQYIELMVTYRNKKDLAFISDNDAFTIIYFSFSDNAVRLNNALICSKIMSLFSLSSLLL